MKSREVLEGKTRKELLVVAKELNLVGRHSLSKADLITSLLELNQISMEVVEEEIEPVEVSANTYECKRAMKLPYIQSAKTGTIIAFVLPGHGRAISGKVLSAGVNAFRVETRNGIRFLVEKRDVIWVKTSERWPNGVYKAFKGLDNT